MLSEALAKGQKLDPPPGSFSSVLSLHGVLGQAVCSSVSRGAPSPAGLSVSSGVAVPLSPWALRVTTRTAAPLLQSESRWPRHAPEGGLVHGGPGLGVAGSRATGGGLSSLAGREPPPAVVMPSGQIRRKPHFPSAQEALTPTEVSALEINFSAPAQPRAEATGLY